MFVKLKQMWDTCVNNGRNFITSYRNGDPLMVKKNINCSVSMYKRSAPDKPWLNVAVTGEPEMNLLDIIMLAGLITSGISIICMISKCIFKIRYHDRW